MQVKAVTRAGGHEGEKEVESDSPGSPGVWLRHEGRSDEEADQVCAAVQIVDRHLVQELKKRPRVGVNRGVEKG